jgi:acylphosphatase
VSVARQRVLVSGRVQGVWFRESARRRSEHLGLAGWVRNTSAGAVEAVFEGPVAAVDEMVHWCRMGPPDARVDDVLVFDEEPEGLRGFEVR